MVGGKDTRSVDAGNSVSMMSTTTDGATIAAAAEVAKCIDGRNQPVGSSHVPFAQKGGDAIEASSGSVIGPSSGRRNSSIDKQQPSNRSSFAAEAIPHGRQQAAIAAARGSRGSGGTSYEGNSPLPQGVDQARSSAQARISSIQAADVMGVGVDKAAVVPRSKSRSGRLSSALGDTMRC